MLQLGAGSGEKVPDPEGQKSPDSYPHHCIAVSSKALDPDPVRIMPDPGWFSESRIFDTNFFKKRALVLK